MATIDTALVQALIEARLITNLGADLVYVPMNETPGEGIAAYCQLVAVDFLPRHQQGSGENDPQGVVVTAAVGVPRSHSSAHALAGALEIARRALDRQTIDDSITSGHVVRLDRATATQDPAAFAGRDSRTGVVSAGGDAQRGSGTTRTGYLA